MYSHLEDYIHRLYSSLGIFKPSDLDMHSIAKEIGVKISYDLDMFFNFDNEIVLRKSTKEQEWLDFAHELCHFLRHHGSQLNMNPLFRELQEYQANHFVYHFCVPTFMLDEIKYVNVYEIMNIFSVDFDFALKRLEMYENKHLTFVSYGNRSLKIK